MVERVMSPFGIPRIDGEGGLLVVEPTVQEAPSDGAEREALAAAIRSDPGLGSACDIVDRALRREGTARDGSLLPRPPVRKSLRYWKRQPAA